jgi:predicted acylesterase/phospholipase RssA
MRAMPRFFPLFPLLLLALATGCATAPLHRAVPPQALSEAVVEGFSPGIRFWADEAPPNIGEMIHERITAYRAQNAAYFAQHGAYPDLHYLAISGGAYDGAFGAGLLCGWADAGTRPDFALVTGVSTGALIAPFVFIGPGYDDEIREFFTKTRSDMIFVSSVGQVLDGLTGGLAVTDSAPLARKIETHVTPEVMQRIAAEHRKGKRLFLGTTNIEAQRGVIWDIGAIADSGNPKALALIRRIMLASAAVPGLFAPVFIEVEIGAERYTEIHADGGVTSQVFLYPLKLQRSVIDEFLRYNLKRHLYIVRNSKITPEYQALQPGLFSLTRRSIETLTKYQGLGDLYRLYVGAQRDGVEYNLITIPEGFTAQSQEIFDPAYMSALFDVGYQMGRSGSQWQKKPPGVDYLSASPPNAKTRAKQRMLRAP